MCTQCVLRMSSHIKVELNNFFDNEIEIFKINKALTICEIRVEMKINESQICIFVSTNEKLYKLKK
jgi:hypothetical protein